MSELPEKLNLRKYACCSAEIEANEIAREYNSLGPNDPKRKAIYEKWKAKDLEAFMD